MIMFAAAPTPVPVVPTVPGPSPVSGDPGRLFDQMVNRAQYEPPRAGLGQVTQSVMDKLDGFVERSSLLQRTRAPSSTVQNMVPGGAQGSSTAASGIEQAMQSMQWMFDRSIETQLVVRAATQVSGAASTLVRGQ
jgi:hypothetical protein